MNIAAVTHSLSMLGGGIPAVMRPVYKKIAENRMNHASLFGLADSSALEPAESWGLARAQTFPVNGPAAVGYSRRLRRALMQHNGEVIHTHGIFKHTSADVHVTSRRQNIPYVVAPHGMLDPWALGQSPSKKRIASYWFENAHLRDAKCFHALCRSEAADIRRLGYSQPIFVIPNGIDLPQPADSVVSRRLRRPVSSPLPELRRTLLFLGRIHPKKGLQELLQAWQQWQNDGIDDVRKSRLLIAGWDDGGFESGLRSWVADHGLTDSIEFIGPVVGEAKTRLLATANGFILPSLSEGLPMSILEAWSFRLPVIMTDHCHLPEGFQSDAAIHIEPTRDSIAVGLRHWGNSTDLELQRIGDNGRALVAQSFTWEQVATKYIAMYEWMLGGDLPDFAIEDALVKR